MAKYYEFILKNWNALLAGISLAGVAIFALAPPLQQYVKVFIFLAANAIVWTLIEIKVQLSGQSNVDEQTYANMRVARPHIIEDIERRLKRAVRDQPLILTLIGGSMRSMGDVIREMADDLKRGKTRGHLVIEAYCIDPEYMSQRVLPGDLPIADQRKRNSDAGQALRSLRPELESFSKIFSSDSSLAVTVTYYAEEPFCYAYLIGDELLYWGPFTWDRTRSDLVGPENPCMVVKSSAPTFPGLRDWVQTRTAYYKEQSQRREAGPPNR